MFKKIIFTLLLLFILVSIAESQVKLYWIDTTGGVQRLREVSSIYPLPVRLIGGTTISGFNSDSLWYYLYNNTTNSIKGDTAFFNVYNGVESFNSDSMFYYLTGKVAFLDSVNTFTQSNYFPTIHARIGFIDTVYTSYIDSTYSTYWYYPGGDSLFGFISTALDSAYFKKMYIGSLHTQTILNDSSVTTNKLYSDTIIGNSPIFLISDSVYIGKTNPMLFNVSDGTLIIDTIKVKSFVLRDATEFVINIGGIDIAVFNSSGVEPIGTKDIGISGIPFDSAFVNHYKGTTAYLDTLKLGTTWIYHRTLNSGADSLSLQIAGTTALKLTPTYIKSSYPITVGTDYVMVWKGASSEAPANPVTGWVYVDSDNSDAYIYNGSSWILLYSP